ncbi:YncE family protein [Cellulomonas sp. URHD0024]|uniref:YncE family protein n=1 Tax=Cellulomonas sp. URHD0024 TaxID=1302620 RepID=UPI0003FA1A53|nr:hypothetical protein [Cellulomonas sp. URHD0024]
MDGRRRRGWWRPRALTGAVVAAAVLVPMTVAALDGRGNALERFVQSGGGAWVTSPSQGLVSLIDGPSEQVVAGIRLHAQDHELDVVQSGSSAYLADTTDGTVARIDGATDEVTDPIRFTPAGGGLTVLRNADVVYVLDPARRTASSVDPRSLRVRRALSLAAQPGPGQAVVDDSGRLWVIDRTSGALTWFDPDKHVDAGAHAAASRLVLVEGRPVLVDTTTGSVRTLGDAGVARNASCLDVRSSDDVHLLGSRTRAEVFAAVPATGTVVVASVDHDDCSRFIQVADPDATFGALAQSGRFVFVPVTSTGRTRVIDTTDDRIVGTFDLAAPGHDVELIDKDGLVFYNDRDGSDAGVLRLDGDTWRASHALQKYDPTTGKAAAIVTPEPQAPATAAPAAPTPGPSRAPAPAPSRSASHRPPSTVVPAPSRTPRPGGTTRPGGGTHQGGDAGPVVGALTLAPVPAVLGGSVTISAPAQNADGATWTWSLSRPGGPVLATASSVGTMSATLPYTGGADFVVTLTVRTARGTATATPLAFTADPAPYVQVTSVTADATTYTLGQTVHLSATTTGAPPGTAFNWSYQSDVGNGFIQTTTDYAPITFTPGAAGSYQITLELLTPDGAMNAGTTTFVVGLPCSASPDAIAVGTGTLDVSSGSANLGLTAPGGCVGGFDVTFEMPGWLQVSPSTVTVPAGQSTSVTVTRAGTPPVDGDNGLALYLTSNGGSGPAVSIFANIPPTSAGPDSCTMPGGPLRAVTTFWNDGDLAGLTGTLTIGGQRFPITNINPTQPTSFRALVDTTTIAGATQYTVVARDRYGARSAPYHGTLC